MKLWSEMPPGRHVRRNLMLLLCAVLLPLTIAGIYNEIRSRSERVRDVHADALRFAQLVHSDIFNVIQGSRHLLVAIATLPAVRDLDAGNCGARLMELRAQFDRYTSIVLADWQGMIVCSSGAPMPPQLIKDRPYIAEARASRRFVIGRYTLTRSSQKPVLPLVLPFRKDGEWAGLLIATLDLDWLSQLLTTFPNEIENTVIAVADADGVFLARNIDAARFVGRPFRDDAMWPVHASSPGTTEMSGIEGVTRILGYVPASAPPGGLYVGIGIDRALAMHPVNLWTILGSLGIGLGFLVALGIGWIGASRFVELQERILARTAELETEREHRGKVEAALAQSQRLEALGQLTAGLAHDFNNLLAVVLGNLEIARARLRDDAGIDRLLDRAASAAERGTGLTQQLLAFARNQQLSTEPVDPNQLVADVQDLMERSVGGVTRIRRDLAPDAAPILADRGQLEVALLNLILNARDAMPFGGTITLATRNSSPDALPPDVAPGDYVQINVSDTGPGMTPEVRARAFEPFYTTKEVGKGSGLGLAQVYGIARQSGGTVAIDSEPGKGTSVTIYLPRASGAPAPSTTPHDATRRAAAGAGRAIRILLVDDEPDVRDVVATLLRALGHSVVPFDSGAAALSHLAANRDADVLISDMVMPEMSGREVAERATGLVPDLRVLFISGFATDRQIDDLGWPVLRKPFKSTDIEIALATVMTPAGAADVVAGAAGGAGGG